METRNLEFYKSVEGSKTHYIFTQGKTFYVFTEMDDDTRGNFSIVDQSEVDETEKLIGKMRLRQFHPRELDRYDFETGKDYRVQRIRDICYILIAKRILDLEKVGREILFNCINVNISKTNSSNLIKTFSGNKNNSQKIMKQKSKKIKNFSLENFSGRCPECKQNVQRNLIKVHLEYTCPKR